MIVNVNQHMLWHLAYGWLQLRQEKDSGYKQTRNRLIRIRNALYQMKYLPHYVFKIETYTSALDAEYKVG